MVQMVPDRTGRFSKRPHYQAEELDQECEQIVTQFLRSLHGEAVFPITTDDLTKLIERDADDLDLYAELSHLGPDVEGVTEFHPGRRPVVRISAELSGDPRRENRLRTTLAHEYGHVHFHAYLWELRDRETDLFDPRKAAEPSQCKRDTMLSASQSDWMEWQAGYVCGALLMPRRELARVVGTYLEQHELFGPQSAEGVHGRALIAEVVDAFQVSEDAARVRLAKLDHLGTERGPSLFNLAQQRS